MTQFDVDDLPLSNERNELGFRCFRRFQRGFSETIRVDLLLFPFHIFDRFFENTIFQCEVNLNNSSIGCRGEDERQEFYRRGEKILNGLRVVIRKMDIGLNVETETNDADETMSHLRQESFDIWD